MVIHILQGKGSSDRDVPMTPKLLEALREYWRWKRPKVYLFPSTAGHRGVEQPLSDHTIWYVCSEAAKRAGIKKTIGAAHDAPQLRDTPDGGRDRPADDPASAGARAPGTHHVYLHLSQRHLHAAVNPLDQITVGSHSSTRKRHRRTIKRDTATLGGGRHHPQGRKPIHRTLSWLGDLGTAQSAPGHRTLPHRRAGRASRSMRSLRPSGHLVQLLPESPLSEVPDQCTREVAARPATRTAAGGLLPSRLQRAARAGPADLAEQESPVPPAVRGQRRYAARKLPPIRAHLGAEIGFLSILHTWGQTLQRHPHIHCVVPGGGLSPDHARWIPSRSHFFLPVRVLSRVFRGKFVAGLAALSVPSSMLWRSMELPTAGPGEGIRGVPAHPLPAGLGGVRQAAVRRAGTCSAVSGPLHASRSHLQPPVAIRG